MKHRFCTVMRSFPIRLTFVLVSLLFAPNARSGLGLNLDLYKSIDPNSGQTNWYSWASLSTSDTIATYYQLYSPHTNILGSIGTGGTTSTIYFTSLPSMLDEITNGNWTLILNVGDPSQQTYTFQITTNGIAESNFPAFQITSPAFHGSVSNAAVNLTWSGPTNWDNIYVNLHDNSYAFYQSSTLPGNATNWDGNAFLDWTHYDYTFGLDFATNGSPYFAFSTPVTAASQPLAGWSPTATLHLDENLDFYANYTLAFSGHELVAHYTFDNSGYLGRDTSTNGNDLNGASWWGTPQVYSTNAKVGGGSVQFFGTSSMTPNGQSFGSWIATLGGSFTISAWIKTTNSKGSASDDAINGAAILWAYRNGTDDTIPLSLTGGKVAFSTYDRLGNVATLHSTASVNDGAYHLITVTRDQLSGVKSIYVDGNLEGTQAGTTDPLNGNTNYLSLGGSTTSSYIGLLDDVQIYAGVLSATEVAALFASPGTTVPDKKGAASNGLVVHYDFDEGTVLAPDVSGNGNDMVHAGNFSGGGPFITSDSASGAGSVGFDGGSYLTAASNLLSTLSGEFSVSVWLKTSQSYGNPGDLAWAGAGVICADSPNAGAKDLIPIALTGGQVAFNIGDGVNDDTLNSTATVNDGAWHHVVVTRDITTGNRQIYIDGNLDSSKISATVLLDSPVLLTIGAKADASNSNPASPDSTGSNGYEGHLDDLQIYNRVLGANEIHFLYSNPGSVLAGLTFATAIGASNLQWSTHGDTPWFVETTNTYSGSLAAAQSGSVSNSQSSTLSATVTGPGTLNFYWSSIANDPNGQFVYEFDIDSTPLDSLTGDNSWQASVNGPYTIPAGTHTLAWIVSANGDTDPAQAGFLDNIAYVPDTVPVITLNPFNQTNCPGYPVWLNAGATSNPAATWQWYKVGSGAISGATYSYFTPANSGAASVAGSYYAIASNDAGSANTATAVVSFVSAPLPPDWSRALKSPFQPVDHYQLTQDYYYGCVTDTNGNVYVAAQFIGNTTFGTSNLNSGTNNAAAIVKQSPSGAPLWAVGITNSGSGSASAFCVALASDGGAYVAGNYSGNNWLGTNALTDTGNGDIFVARVDASGSNVWVKTFGSANADFLVMNSLASDADGNVTLSGFFGAGSVSLGSSNYVITGSQSVMFQLDPGGAVRWSQLLPHGWPQSLTFDAGRLYVGIDSSVSGGTTNVVIGGVSNFTDRAWAVACLSNTNGQALWVQAVGAQYESRNGNPYATGLVDDTPRIAVSGTNVFLTGTAYGSSAAFGAMTVNFDDLCGQYFARYDTNGNVLTVTNYGSVTTRPFAIVADARGDVYVCGDFDTYSVFGNDLIAAPAATRPFSGEFYSQAFLARFDLDGNPLWAREAVASATVNLHGIALASGAVWVSGWDQSGFPVVPTKFGTNNVDCDYLWVSGPAGGGTIAFPYPAGVLAKVGTQLPLAADLALALVTNTPATFPLAKYASDPESYALTVSFSGFSDGGTASYDGVSGLVTYTPASNFSGTETFTYTVSDPYGNLASATVTATVSAPSGSGANILSATYDSGTQKAAITFAGIPGATYALEYTTDLNAGTWTQVGNNVTLPAIGQPSAGVATVIQSSAPSSTAFYRTVYVSGP